MALVLAGDVISSALRGAGVVGVGQTANPQDTQDGLDLMNTLLTTWQINRWLVQDLLDLAFASTASSSYSVGPGGDFATPNATPRPDKLDAAFARLVSTGEDTYLYPYMSREGYDRAPFKSAVGVPLAYFYDATLTTTGNVFFAPVPSAAYSLHVNAKNALGQFAATTDTITLPQPYIVALLWNLAAELRPYFQMPEDPQVTRRAETSLAAMINSIAQVPTVVAPRPANRGGIYSVMPPPGAPTQGPPER
jgi:hypothetical protein